LHFPWHCINYSYFSEHLDISTYHVTPSPDLPTWFWSPYDQHPIIPMTVAHGLLACIIPFPCGTLPTFRKLIVFWMDLGKFSHLLDITIFGSIIPPISPHVFPF
jgi:hypothetical protein